MHCGYNLDHFFSGKGRLNLASSDAHIHFFINKDARHWGQNRLHKLASKGRKNPLMTKSTFFGNNAFKEITHRSWCCRKSEPTVQGQTGHFHPGAESNHSRSDLWHGDNAFNNETTHMRPYRIRPVKADHVFSPEKKKCWRRLKIVVASSGSGRSWPPPERRNPMHWPSRRCP